MLHMSCYMLDSVHCERRRYVQDFPWVVVDNDADIIVHADDNTPFSADSDPEIPQVKLQQEADSVTNWFEKNDLVISSGSK